MWKCEPVDCCSVSVNLALIRPEREQRSSACLTRPVSSSSHTFLFYSLNLPVTCLFYSPSFQGRKCRPNVRFVSLTVEVHLAAQLTLAGCEESGLVIVQSLTLEHTVILPVVGGNQGSNQATSNYFRSGKCLSRQVTRGQSESSLHQFLVINPNSVWVWPNKLDF